MLNLETIICDHLLSIDKDIEDLRKVAKKLADNPETELAEHVTNQESIFEIEDKMIEMDRFFSRLQTIKNAYDISRNKYAVVLSLLKKDEPKECEIASEVVEDVVENVEVITNEETDK